MDTKPCQSHLLTGRWLGFALALLLWITGASPARAGALAQVGTSPEAEQVARTINQLRAQAGLPPLAVHPLLTQAATAHVQDMIASGRYGHTGSDGSNVRQRVARTGYQVAGWAGEIWAGYLSVEQAFQAWMDSPPHRDSILNPSYREMGIATAVHPNGRQLIIVVDFTTGSKNQDPGQIPSPAEGTAPSTAPDVASSDLPVDGRYAVQAGDTLFSIGLRFGVDWRELAAANGLEADSILQIGQVLQLPGVAPTSTAPPLEEEIFYVVRAGDTLYSIALKYGLTWQQLAAANKLDERSILHVGDRLRIPAADAATPVRFHVVRPGDTVMGIAARYGVDWQEVLRLNGLTTTSLLRIGQQLRVP